MTRHMPIWSHIVVDAPAPFDFTELCIVNHLHPEYYQATAAKKHAAVVLLGCDKQKVSVAINFWIAGILQREGKGVVLCSLLRQDWEALPWGTEIVGPKATTSTLGDEINCSVDAWQTWGL